MNFAALNRTREIAFAEEDSSWGRGTSSCRAADRRRQIPIATVSSSLLGIIPERRGAGGEIGCRNSVHKDGIAETLAWNWRKRWL
jgi:hypothetical protein